MDLDERIATVLAAAYAAGRYEYSRTFPRGTFTRVSWLQENGTWRTYLGSGFHMGGNILCSRELIETPEQFAERVEGHQRGRPTETRRPNL